MNNLFFLLQKEFKQIFRNPTILRMIIAMPIIQLILLPLAANYEVKNINISIVDHDHSAYSNRLIQKISASTYFNLSEYTDSYAKSLENIGKGKTDLVLTIPAHFERDLVKENSAKLHLAADAVNGIRGGLGSAYISQVIGDFNREVREEWILLPRKSEIPQIDISSAN